jgi:hypothetical protein
VPQRFECDDRLNTTTNAQVLDKSANIAALISGPITNIILRPSCCHSQSRMSPQRKTKKEMSSVRNAARVAEPVGAAFPAVLPIEEILASVSCC